jgi:hypothetical protein
MNPHQQGMIRERIQTVLQEPHWLVPITSAKRGTVSTLDLKPWVSEITVDVAAKQQAFTLSFTIERANPLVSGGTTWVKPQWLLDFLLGTIAPEEFREVVQAEASVSIPRVLQGIQPVSWLVKRMGLTVKNEALTEKEPACLTPVT